VTVEDEEVTSTVDVEGEAVVGSTCFSEEEAEEEHYHCRIY